MIGVIGIIFGYSFFYGDGGHPVKCYYKEVYGVDCPSCGLSRAFSAILQFDFKAATDLNKSSLWVFSFFLIQLVMRIAINRILSLQKLTLRSIVFTDVSVSVFLFALCFGPYFMAIYSPA